MRRAVSGALLVGTPLAPHFKNCPYSGDSGWPSRCVRSMPVPMAIPIALSRKNCSARHIPERAWKTHDLRNRTIRLVQTGLALMRGGYRELLRPSRRKK